MNNYIFVEINNLKNIIDISKLNKNKMILNNTYYGFTVLFKNYLNNTNIIKVEDNKIEIPFEFCIKSGDLRYDYLIKNSLGFKEVLPDK